MAMLLCLCCRRAWQWGRGKIPAGSRWQSSFITLLVGWFWRHSGGYGGLHRQTHGKTLATRKFCHDQRWQSCHGDGFRRGRMREMERMGCQRDEMRIGVGGRAEGQSVWTTEIKGAGTHETEGRAAERWFHTDDDALRDGRAYVCAPAWTTLSAGLHGNSI